jgi:C4-dicarboxylate-specific signal transduction histidine kinase
MSEDQGMQDKQQRLRFQRLGMASATYAVVTLMAVLVTRLGLGEMSTVQWATFIGLGMLGNTVFFILFYTNTNLRFSDPSLTREQIVYSSVWGMVPLYALPEARPIVLIFFLPAFSFGMLRLTRKQYFSVAAAVMGLYTSVLVLENFQDRQGFRIQYELFLFAIFGTLLTWFAFFGGFVSSLRRRLREQNKKIQKAHKEIKQTQNKLIQSGKLASIGELSAGVAHELNQPLMIIRTTVQLMLRKQSKNALETEYILGKLNAIEKNTKRMMNIINHLRTFSRQTKSEFTPVSVNKIIQDSFMMIGEQLSLRDIEVTQVLSSDLPKVKGDAHQLEQVLLNLLANARDAVESKFEAQGGGAELQKKLVITTQVSGDENETVEILVKDTGSGIPQEALKSIFDPFYTTKEVGKGTGLGLSISYGIIQDHKGEIDVAETGPEGSTFRISLPVA